MDHPSVSTQNTIIYVIKKNVKEVAELVSCLVYSKTLKLEATCSSETSVDLHRIARTYIAEDRILHKHRCDNLKQYVSTKGDMKPVHSFMVLCKPGFIMNHVIENINLRVMFGVNLYI
jgi:hypothetical protein